MREFATLDHRSLSSSSPSRRDPNIQPTRPMNPSPLNVDLEWAFATQRWLVWALPDSDPKHGSGSGTALENEGSMANPDPAEPMDDLDHPHSATAPGPARDQNHHGQSRNQRHQHHHHHRPRPQQLIIDSGRYHDDATSAPAQTTAPAPATKPRPATQPQPLSYPPPAMRPLLRPEVPHSDTRPIPRPKPTRKCITNSPAPGDDRFDLKGQSEENKIHIENGHPRSSINISGL